MAVEKMSIGAKADLQVTCAQCGAEDVASNMNRFNDEKLKEFYVCENCLNTIKQEVELMQVNVKMLPAILGGLGAGIAGAILWYVLTIVSGFEFGYAAIGLGYLVGKSIYFCSGKKLGMKVQILSISITLFSLILANVMLTIAYISGELEAHNQIGTLLLYLFTTAEGLGIFWESFTYSILSPIGLFIYGLAVYISFRVLQVRKIN